ncbi:meprin A subunit beta-like [Chanos chanos]|uniref:Metalloendopeptidase n=1 Tax=Chanos chanos TaxID=29144 RepID=A0A6J2WBF6_CHACN|nr:meprin A subunit beta-like [Chanos chanos]
MGSAKGLEIHHHDLHDQFDVFIDYVSFLECIIDDLNLHEGDIMQSNLRSSISLPGYKWESPVPYVLDESLDMNAKGVILRAFEQFRLKTCIDFKPRETEDYYIRVKKLTGCWSYVGRATSGGQELSIGAGCDTIATVEHEFLHALGFLHEQSRYDRDEHVIINYDNILEGLENNFNKVGADISSTLGTPYDYMSVMHYGKDAFTNGNGPTIITRLPEFQDVIGQYLEMSSYDVFELNKLYGCYASISLVEHCSFNNESICQMSRCSSNTVGWERVSNTTGGPHTDHTYLGKENNGEISKSAYFMHFSTVNGKQGDTARLETKRMTPRRDCKVQCLQFFYYHSGNESDQLNIWIREFDSEDDTNGTLRIMDQITGTKADYWQLHYIPINAKKTFQVEFEVSKRGLNSNGGFSLDDINLSETECPQQIWHIRDFETLLNTTPSGTFKYSPKYYSPEGYHYQIMLQLNVDRFGIYVRLVSGDYDDQLQWPCPWRQVTFLLLDQNPNIQQRMSKQRSIITDPTYTNDDGSYFWGNPREVGNRQTDENGEFYAGNGYGTSVFMTLKDLKTREFLKGGDIFLLFSMQDLSQLLQSDSLPCPSVSARNITVFPDVHAEQGPCSARCDEN